MNFYSQIIKEPSTHCSTPLEEQRKRKAEYEDLARKEQQSPHARFFKTLFTDEKTYFSLLNKTNPQFLDILMPYVITNSLVSSDYYDFSLISLCKDTIIDEASRIAVLANKVALLSKEKNIYLLDTNCKTLDILNATQPIKSITSIRNSILVYAGETIVKLSEIGAFSHISRENVVSPPIIFSPKVAADFQNEGNYYHIVAPFSIQINEFQKQASLFHVNKASLPKEARNGMKALCLDSNKNLFVGYDNGCITVYYKQTNSKVTYLLPVRTPCKLLQLKMDAVNRLFLLTNVGLYIFQGDCCINNH